MTTEDYLRVARNAARRHKTPFYPREDAEQDALLRLLRYRPQTRRDAYNQAYYGIKDGQRQTQYNRPLRVPRGADPGTLNYSLSLSGMVKPKGRLYYCPVAHTLSDPRDCIGEIIRKDEIHHLLQGLKRRTRQILDWISRGCTYREIGEYYGISENRVQQIVTKVKVQLRDRLAEEQSSSEGCPGP